MIIYLISTGIAIMLFLYIIAAHNALVRKSNAVDQAYTSLEIYLKKRYDLMPNLVAIVKKYAQYEKDVLTDITKLREASAAPDSTTDKILAENKTEHLLSSIRLNVERYPELKADRQFLNLQFSLNDIEDQLAASRRAFNAAVTAYNISINQFPQSIIARTKGYTTKPLLNIPKQEQQNVALSDLL